MENTTAQLIFASAGYYKGAIDGLVGPLMRRAVDVIEANAGGWPKTWSWRRRCVAAAQRVLDVQGYQPGPVDGWFGPDTAEAATQWLSAAVGTDAKVARVARQDGPSPRALPLQRECTAVYGDPETEVPHRLQIFSLPEAMRLDWNLSQRVRRVTLHRDCGDSFIAAQREVIATYGLSRWRQLGLDRYAGGYIKRRMRGGAAWSMHSYGCAVDIYAAPNGLRMRCPDALFCRAEYQPFLDIMEHHGWLPALRLWGADAMHFQRARLK